MALAGAARIANETLRLANTGMAVIIDIGESRDIHPKNKQDVGLRLALAARAIAYGQPVEYSGPMFRTATPEGARDARLLDARRRHDRRAAAAEIKGFEVAGADGQFAPAEAKVEGDTIVVVERFGGDAGERALWLGGRSGLQPGQPGGAAGEPVPQRMLPAMAGAGARLSCLRSTYD